MRARVGTFVVLVVALAIVFAPVAQAATPTKIVHFHAGTYRPASTWLVNMYGDLSSMRAKCRKNRDINVYANMAYQGQFSSDLKGHFNFDRTAIDGTWVLKVPRGGDGHKGCGGAKKSFNVVVPP